MFGIGAARHLVGGGAVSSTIFFCKLTVEGGFSSKPQKYPGTVLSKFFNRNSLFFHQSLRVKYIFSLKVNRAQACSQDFFFFVRTYNLSTIYGEI